MARVVGLFLIILGVFVVVGAAMALFIGWNANAPFNNTWIAVAIVGVIFGISFIAGGFVVARRSPPLRGGVGATPAGTPDGNYVAHTPQQRMLDGTPYTIVYTPPIKGKNARPSTLKISTPFNGDGEFEIVPESGFDRWAKRWGLTTEIATLDETFDHHCFVRSDTVEFTKALLEHPDNRDIIRDLHRQGFKAVTLKDRELSASWIGFAPTVNDTPDLTEEIGARLILMSRKIPSDLPEPDMSGAKRRHRWQAVLWLGSILFALSALTLVPFTPVHFSEILVPALFLLLVLFPAGLVGAAWVLRGTSRSHYAWIIWSIASVFLMPAGSIGIVTVANGLFDQSPDVQHEALILRRYTTKNKNSTSYHVECESWRTPGGTEKFQISMNEYNRVIERQSQLKVVTRSGNLGVEWIRGKEVVSPKLPKIRG